jgi:predicted nucleic acid-binding protein
VALRNSERATDGRAARPHRCGFARSRLGNLAALDIEIDEESDAQVWSATVQLADRYRLTVYDAAYLELAQRSRLPLATLDVALATAAQAAGVAVRP